MGRKTHASKQTWRRVSESNHGERICLSDFSSSAHKERVQRAKIGRELTSKVNHFRARPLTHMFPCRVPPNDLGASDRHSDELCKTSPRNARPSNRRGSTRPGRSRRLRVEARDGSRAQSSQFRPRSFCMCCNACACARSRRSRRQQVDDKPRLTGARTS